MQALSSIGSTLSGGQGLMSGITNTLNLASGLAGSFAPLFTGQGNPMMGMMQGLPFAMKGLQGMMPHMPAPVNRIDDSMGITPPSSFGLTPPNIDWGSLFGGNSSTPSSGGGF